MDLSYSQGRDCLRVSLRGRLDQTGARRLRSVFDNVNLLATREVVLDCAGLDSLTSEGISALVSFHKALSHHEARLRLVQLPRNIYDLLRLMHLSDVFSLSLAE